MAFPPGSGNRGLSVSSLVEVEGGDAMQPDVFPFVSGVYVLICFISITCFYL